MSDLLQKFNLYKEAYFSQPPDDHERKEISGVVDNDTVVNLADRVHGKGHHTGMPHIVKTENIDNNLVNAEKNEVEVDKNPVEGVQDILRTKPEEFTGAGSAQEAGAIAFSAKTMAKGRGRPRKAGALAMNDEELVQQIKALKKGDKLGSGALTTAAITGLITAAPEIIRAIGTLRKGKGYTGSGEVFVKNLSPDKFDAMENLMKQINRQKKYFKFDSATNEYEVGSGKFGDFMSKAWSKVKQIWGSEGFKPIKEALLNAANNTAQSAIDTAAKKVSSKVQNEDLANMHHQEVSEETLYLS